MQASTENACCCGTPTVMARYSLLTVRSLQCAKHDDIPWAKLGRVQGCVYEQSMKAPAANQPTLSSQLPNELRLLYLHVTATHTVIDRTAGLKCAWSHAQVTPHLKTARLVRQLT
jgi:hypothetical protein